MTARDIFNGSTGNRARILILDADGLPKTGVAYNAAGLSIAYKINTGSEVAITLTSGNWHETGGGKYLVDVADSVYAAGNLGALVQFYGALTSSSVYGEQHRVVAYNPLAVAVGANTTTPPTAAANALAVAQYDQRQQGSTVGTIGWYFKKLRQANLAIEATVTADVTATTKTFSVNLTTYPTGAFRHAVMTVVEDSAILEQNSPIETFTNNTTFSTIVLEEELTAAPQPGDVIVISANSHVHSIASITSGVWSALTSGLNVDGSTGAVVKALASMLEFVSGIWRWKASSLSQAPTGGGGGDATEAKQDQIISLIQGSEVLTVASPNVRGNLVLTQGDTYDGATGSNPKATWTVTTDYTDGWSVVLTIRDKDDAVVYTNTGTVPNATTVTVPIVTPTVTPFEGCPGVWQGKYDVQLSKSTSKKTIAIGVVYINEDQTRS